MIGLKIQIGNIFKRKATRMVELQKTANDGRSAGAVLNSRIFAICSEITANYDKQQNKLLVTGSKDDERVRGRIEGAKHLRSELESRVELGKKAEMELQKHKGSGK